jgi:hypothetical protein
LVVLAAPQTAVGQTTSTWNGTTGNWTNAGIWSAGVPNNGGGNTFNAEVNGAGTITLDSPITIEQLNFAAGTITGANNLTLNAGTSWSGGTFSGSGTTAASGGVTIFGTGTKTFDQRSLTLGGTSTWSGGTIAPSNGAVITVAAGGTLTATSNDTINNSTGTAATFAVAGTFTKNQGTGMINGTTTISNVTFTNSGTINVMDGMLAAAGGLTNTGTVYLATPGSFNGPITSNAGGMIRGFGMFSGPLTMNPGSTLAPGLNSVTGFTMSVSGNVTFTANATYAARINGASYSSYDTFTLTGTAPVLTLANATFAPTLGYTPANSDKIFVIKFSNGTPGTISGTFNGIPQDGQITIGGYLARVSYHGKFAGQQTTGGNDVVVYDFIPVPEPAACLGLAVVGIVLFRRQSGRSPTGVNGVNW